MNPAFLQFVACSVGASEGENSSTRSGWSIAHADLKSPADHKVIGAWKQVAVLIIRSEGPDRTPSSVLGYSVVQSEVGWYCRPLAEIQHGFGPGRGAGDALDFYIDDGARSQ